MVDKQSDQAGSELTAAALTFYHALMKHAGKHGGGKLRLEVQHPMFNDLRKIAGSRDPSGVTEHGALAIGPFEIIRIGDQ